MVNTQPSIEEKKLIEDWSQQAKDSLQGVVRLGVSLEELQSILNGISSITSYVITYEKEPDPHIHYIIMGPKKLHVNPTKKLIKDGITKLGKNPKIYHNGMLNMSRVKSTWEMLCYVFKEHKKDYFGYKSKNLPHGIAELAKNNSYLKVNSLMKEVQKIKMSVVNKIRTPEDATVCYGLLRKAYGKPDPNWYNFYLKMEIIFQSDEEYEQKIRDKIRNGI